MSANIHNALLTAIAAEQAAMARFVDQLNEEADCLRRGAFESLENLVPRKTALASELNRQAIARNQALHAAGFPTQDKINIERLGSKEIAAAWKQLLETARQANDLNRINGEVIRTRLAENTNALNTLLSASEPGAIYGPGGKPQGIGSGRNFGSA